MGDRDWTTPQARISEAMVEAISRIMAGFQVEPCAMVCG